MKKFLRHSWPILVFFLTQIIQLQAPAYLGIEESFYVDRFLPDFTLMSSLVAIYYLFKSPFSNSHNWVLSLLILQRIIVVDVIEIDFLNEAIISIGTEILMVIFYILRTRAKDIIRLGDKFKAFCLTICFVFSWIDALIRLTFKGIIPFYLQEAQLSDLQNILEISAFFLGLSFTIIHLTMLYKWNYKYISEAQDMMIDQIGK